MSLSCPHCEAGEDRCLCVSETDKVLASYKIYSDSYGLLHLGQRPDPEQCENAPMYTGLFWSVFRELGPIEYLPKNPMHHLWFDDHYRTTPLTTKPFDLSHDNMTGIICFSEIYGYEWALYKSKQFMHPRDIAFYLYAKYPHWFFWLLPITSIAMIISCAQTYKTRNGKKMLRTDGKLLALMRCLAFNMNVTLSICTWLINKNKNFKSWCNVARIYFGNDHPCTRVIREWQSKK